MKNKETAILVIVSFLLIILACNGSRQSSYQPSTTTYSPPKPTPTPEKEIEMSLIEIMETRQGIDNALSAGFLRCDEEDKEQWFAVHEKTGKKVLLEFVHFTHFEGLPVKGTFWEFGQGKLIEREKLGKTVTHKGSITFISHDNNVDGKKNFLSVYNKKLNQWMTLENFDKWQREKYNLPETIFVRRNKGAWEYSLTSDNNDWTANFPFSKPNFSCEQLKANDESLRSYTTNLSAIEEFNKPEKEVSVTNTSTDEDSDDDSFSKGYINIKGVNLRSDPHSDSDDNIVGQWSKNTTVEILSSEIGDKRKQPGNPNKKWYKVRIIKGSCVSEFDCEQEGYIHSDLISLLPNQ